MASYVQASSNSAPSASQMAANSTGSRMDIGLSTAAELDATRMAYQQAYSNPLEFYKESKYNGPGANGVDFNATDNLPGGYNTSGPYPAKYDMPTPAKERLNARQALRMTAPGLNIAGNRTSGTQIIDSISEEEVDYLQGMQRQAELADYDRYVSTLVDPRQPGQLRWLYEVYPDFVHRRIAAVQQDFDFAIKNKLIDMWGINSKEDLDFKYQVDQGKIDGPRLFRPPPAFDNQYKAGMLAPWYYMRGREEGINLPFTSAQDGPRPPSQNSWTMSDYSRDGKGQPLSSGRGLRQMAAELMGTSGADQPADHTWRYNILNNQNLGGDPGQNATAYANGGMYGGLRPEIPGVGAARSTRGAL